MSKTRHIVLDTETTGLDPAEGHRIIEIGCVELVDDLPSGKTFQTYINPECQVSEATIEITGLTDNFLTDKPVFSQISDDLLEFIGDAPLIIHNAPFDMGFLHSEFGRLSRTALTDNAIIDTLEMARRKFPGAPASLDALCSRFEVDNTIRDKHGALLDSHLLAEVYLGLTGGREPGLVFAAASTTTRITNAQDHTLARNDDAPPPYPPALARPQPLPSRLRADEKTAHLEFIQQLKTHSLWFTSK